MMSQFKIVSKIPSTMPQRIKRGDGNCMFDFSFHQADQNHLKMILGMSTSSLPGPMESGELEGRKEADY
jgi:hypothetical protein